MSTIDAPRQDSIATDLDTDASHDDLVTVVNQLADEVADLREENDDLREENQELRDRVDDLEEQADDRDARLSAVSKGLSTAHDEIEEIQTREADIDGHDPDGSSGENTGPETTIEPETPLESVTALPESLAETELTANQRRARFVAKDVTQYARSVPAGYAVKSSEIATVLRAGTECDGRSQTVSRVIGFLNDLGGEETQVVERRGERRVVFTEESVTRLQQLTSRPATNHTVVAEGGA
jgi:hypothetical protein